LLIRIKAHARRVSLNFLRVKIAIKHIQLQTTRPRLEWRLKVVEHSLKRVIEEIMKTRNSADADMLVISNLGIAVNQALRETEVSVPVTQIQQVVEKMRPFSKLHHAEKLDWFLDNLSVLAHEALQLVEDISTIQDDHHF
jgi:hypothetical protein